MTMSELGTSGELLAAIVYPADFIIRIVIVVMPSSGLFPMASD